MSISKSKSYWSKLSSLALKVGLDWYILAIIGMIIIASIWPTPGIQKGFFSLKNLTAVGVSLIFFFYGLRLSPQKLREGISNWRLHMVIQISTFVLFPVLMLILMKVFGTNGNELFWLGAFYVAALPSTVSSAVVMVSIAGGNIPAAIFNASISSLIGVFITPLWMGIVLATSTQGFDLTDVVIKLIVQVLVPVILGIALHSRFGAFADKHRKTMRYFDQSIILLIIYTAFCDSFSNHMFSEHGISDILILGLCMMALFFFVYGVISIISKLMHFNREDNITAVFCGSKKSLVHGTVMSKVLFPNAAAAGIILLPLMIYHALQLMAASIIAQSMARKEGVDKSGE
jgi:solute carrier family 10 (sodium/bile acid cotransporter), member 7